MHREKLGSSMQQCWQHQSVRALFYAEPHLGPVLLLWIFFTFQPFLIITSHLKTIQGYSRQFQAIPGSSRPFNHISAYSSPFQPMTVYLDQFHLSHPWSWLCVSEDLCLEGCFPLDPKPFCKLTVVGRLGSSYHRLGSSDGRLGYSYHRKFRGWREPGNTIKDPGIARTGMGFLVLLLYENTWPGHGPCLAETVWNRSREIFLGLVLECLAGTGHH